MNQIAQPWLSHYPTGVQWNADIKRQPLYETLKKTAHARKDHVAIDFLDFCLTYGELLQQVDQLQRAYKHLA